MLAACRAPQAIHEIKTVVVECVRHQAPPPAPDVPAFDPPKPADFVFFDCDGHEHSLAREAPTGTLHISWNDVRNCVEVE